MNSYKNIIAFLLVYFYTNGLNIKHNNYLKFFKIEQFYYAIRKIVLRWKAHKISVFFFQKWNVFKKEIEYIPHQTKNFFMNILLINIFLLF